ncbi:MAG: outer membrane protein assembly factor BamE [Pseudoxanthomonas sp.]
MPNKFLLPILLAAAVSGCGIVYRQPIYQGNLLDEASVNKLAVGQSRQQVIALLGTPSVADPFHAQRWDYTSQQRTGRLARVQRKNFTVYFDNDQVSRWEGDYFHVDDTELSKTMFKSFGPNLAKDKDKDKKKSSGQ